MITIKESLGVIQKLLALGFETKIADLTPSRFSGLYGSVYAHASFPAAIGPSRKELSSTQLMWAANTAAEYPATRTA